MYEAGHNFTFKKQYYTQSACYNTSIYTIMPTSKTRVNRQCTLRKAQERKNRTCESSVNAYTCAMENKGKHAAQKAVLVQTSFIPLPRVKPLTAQWRRRWPTRCRRKRGTEKRQEKECEHTKNTRQNILDVTIFAQENTRARGRVS